MRRIKHLRLTLNVSRAGYILALTTLFVATFIMVRAQTFSNPPNPAPDNPSLNDFQSSGGSSDFVSLSSTLAQTIDGSLSIATTTQSGAVIGDYINNVSITGFTGVTGLPAAPPDLSSYNISDLTGAAVYGYATGDDASETAIGAYGAVMSGIPVIGETFDAAGFAGKFFGPVEVSDTGSLNGDITVQDKVITSQLIANSLIQTTPALQSFDEVRVEGAYTQGVFSFDDSDAANIGIFSSSATNYSFYAENLYSLLDLSDVYSGIRGESFAQTDGVGVQGYAQLGNGVYGSVDGISAVAVEGVAVGDLLAGEYNAGVYGSGGAFAAYFEGDVNITSGSLYIGDTGISAANLAAMLTWCAGACP